MSERFISRWARLKRSREQAPAPADEKKAPVERHDSARPPGSIEAEARAPGTDEPDAEADTADISAHRPGEAPVVGAPTDPNENLPPIASLTPSSDFTPFLRRGVAPGARNAALKKLFADPHYNVMDGLDVYIEDYNVTEPVPEEILARLLREHASPILAATGEASAVDQAGADGERSLASAASAEEPASAEQTVNVEDGASAEDEAGFEDRAGAGGEVGAEDRAGIENEAGAEDRAGTEDETGAEDRAGTEDEAHLDRAVAPGSGHT